MKFIEAEGELLPFMVQGIVQHQRAMVVVDQGFPFGVSWWDDTGQKVGPACLGSVKCNAATDFVSEAFASEPAAESFKVHWPARWHG